MRYTIIASIIAVIVTGVVVAGAYPIAGVVNGEEDEEEHAVLQVDIDKVFAPFGTPGFFKLLADFTDMRIVHGHVAISNVQCDSNGTSPFVVVANANVGAGNTQLAIIPLNSSNLIDDVSFKCKYCTYHVDIDEEDYGFPVTDIALANSDQNKAYRPHSTASAAIHADIVEMEEHEHEHEHGE